MKKNKLHLICNAHIDPVWQWRSEEGLAAAIATFRSAADLCEEFDYVFCHNEAYLYEQIEKHDPELFARICDLVQKGKWRITGGWYVQPDCNIPSGESLIRQIRVGQNYFTKKFGCKLPTVATNFDSFGHNVGLVRILNMCGQNGYMICRPADWQFAYPADVFTWRGPDNSAVTVARSAAYNSGLGKAMEKIASEDEKSDETHFVLWGVGNHGGGPSRKDLHDIADYMKTHPHVRHSTPEDFFAEAKPRGEVQETLRVCQPGCYSSMSRIKQLHRKTEDLFFGVESLLAYARLCGFTYDESEIDGAQKLLLLSQFHDILPGTVTEEGEANALSFLHSAVEKLESLRMAAVFYLMRFEERAHEGEYPIFVYNYLPYASEQIAEAEFALADQNWSDKVSQIRLMYGDKEIPCQVIKENSTIALDWRKRIVFSAPLESMGLHRLSAYITFVPKSDARPAPVKDEQSLFAENNAILTQPVKLYMYNDVPDPWGMSAQQCKRLCTDPVPFTPLGREERKAFAGVEEDLPAVSHTESGAVLDSYETYYGYAHTRARIEYRFYKHGKFADVNVIVEFAEKNKTVRLAVPSPISGKCVGDGAYIAEEKATDGSEIVFQRMIGWENGDDGFFVLGDGINGGCIEDGELRLTLLRGAGYCFHPIPDRPLCPQDRYLPRIENGRYVFRLRIMRGSKQDAMRMAHEYSRKPYVLHAFANGKKRELPAVAVSDPAVLATAFKPSEDKPGFYVLRLYNPTANVRKCQVRIGKAKSEVTIRATGVVTVLCDGKTVSVTDKAVI